MAQTLASWRDYIDISPDFSPEDRARIEQALSDIWSAADNEGKALIIGAQRNGSGKILISFSDDEDVMMSAERDPDTQKGEIILNPDAIGTMVVTENGRERPVSLTGSLVHELYHLADPNNKGAKGLFALAENVVRGQGGDDAAVQALKKEWGVLMPALGMQGMVDMMLDGDPETNRETIIKELRDVGFAQTATLLENTSPEMFRALLQQGSFIDAKGLLLSEQEAVRFTDAFMLKNFGNAEPQRGDYNNGRQTDTPAPYPVPRVPSVVFTGPGFESELGGMAPTVQPSRTEDYAIRTARVLDL